MEETAGRGVRNDRLIWMRQQGTAGCEEWQVIWSGGTHIRISRL